jgi:hypothetical protein
MDEIFEIQISAFRGGVYKMQVEKYYESSQVIRFKITAGGKGIQMEKILLRHRGQWKITSSNFAFGRLEDSAYNIMRIQQEIDYWLKQRAQKT